MAVSDQDPDTFAEELASLKRRGCSILVVGPPRERPRCESLLGATDRERERIVVDTGHQPPGPAEDRMVVDAGVQMVRSASEATPACDGKLPTLESVETTLLEGISQVTESGLDPGELRVCYGDIERLATRSTEAIESFLRRVSGRVRELNGMGHGHLPVTSPIREEIESCFDVTVEVRSTPEGRQQRWYLHDADLDSGWLAIEE